MLLASPLHAAAQPRPTIEGLAVYLEHDRAMVSFRVAHGISDETLERIHSGIPVSFQHKIELVARRGFMLPARVLVRLVIDTTVHYDPMTRRYDLSRRIELRGGRKRETPPPREETQSTVSVEEMRSWMTEFSDLPVFDPFRSIVGERLRVRVNSSVGRRYIWSIFPANLSASAERKLEP